MNVSPLIIFAGLAMTLTGWIWHRHPGQKFWFAGPVWRASRYLKPAGVRLWAAGTVVSMSGVAWLIIEELGRSA